MAPRQRAKVNRLHRQGYTHAKIAELTGVTSREVRQQTGGRGKPKRSKLILGCPESRAVEELRAEGCSEAAIAASFPGVVR